MLSVESKVLGLSGKNAIVTGAGRGIGKATVTLLSALRVNVVAIDKEFEARTRVSVHRDNIVRLVADVADPNCAKAAVKRCVEQFGTVDVLVNNAAVNLGGALLDSNDREWDRVFEVNLKGYRNFAMTVAKFMIKKKIEGKIVNISSVDGIMAEPGILSYSASKGAIIAFTKCLAVELAPYGIRVNSVAPGWCDTPGGTGGLTPKSRKSVIMRIPLRYIAPPDEIARTIVFLASDLSRYLTGSIILADGGLTSDISIPGLVY